MGKAKKGTDICWDILMIYDTESPTGKIYLLKVDTLHLYLFKSQGYDSAKVALSIDRLADINKGYNFGYAEFGPIRFDEMKYAEMEIRANVEMRNLNSGELIKIIPIKLKANLRTAHESEFLNK